ncbi:hypothetical protein DFJ43DRAFT_1044457 [Lentinula guzmanii]|uniref:Uncharacterized protein n=1 Tax=Lentinula guzmanii TaxID=2804957 RepID=A0AA38J696_9AGAR|nr:hypothetical protein DFJ43DRAFT_1044457 [Lentinula guzmanii]
MNSCDNFHMVTTYTEHLESCTYPVPKSTMRIFVVSGKRFFVLVESTPVIRLDVLVENDSEDEAHSPRLPHTHSRYLSQRDSKTIDKFWITIRRNLGIATCPSTGS